ncbi:RING finger protein unkempt homolog isoform X2 [Stigmatopora argus]
MQKVVRRPSCSSGLLGRPLLHWIYLKEFRTEQCPLFVQHKCTQHRPFSCFHWHFLNQRRRRPVRKRDGTFNYSPDVYCTKYDEGTGTCLDGDECAFLHRTAGDTERRYHLRYYKTGSCIHETDTKGYCSKNGGHCAFAHGSHDLRTPVYDVRESQVMECQGGPAPSEGAAGDGQSAQAASMALIEKILSEEPRWQDNNYVLSHYKTELCKKPPRLCRQGYACPYYHNSKDRRRGPHKHKYRALPCPAVKLSEEWGDPSKCECAEACQYCHTRTEQQFHPEIYKSTKCNDMQQCGSCPRGPFCAFAHVERAFASDESFSCPRSPPLRPPDPASAEEPAEERSGRRRGPAQLAEPLSLPEPVYPWAGEGGHGRAPGFEREDQANKQRSFSLEQRSREVNSAPSSKQDLLAFMPVGSPLSLSSSIPSSLAATPPSPAPPGPAGTAVASGMNANALPFYPTSETVESVVESALDDLDLNDFAASTSESASSLPRVALGLGESRLRSSAPVNIPGSFSTSAPFGSPSPSPPIGARSSSFFSAHLSQSGQQESPFLGASHGSLGLNGMSGNIWEHFPSGQGSPGTPPALMPSNPCAETSRLKQELEEAHRALKQWGHSWRHTAQSWAAVKADAEEARAQAGRAAAEAERSRQADELAQRQSALLEEALETLRSGDNPHRSLRQLQMLHRLPLESVLSLQAQLCSCLQTVDEAVYAKQQQQQQQQQRCVSCGGEPGSVSSPCGHGLRCRSCSASADCPLCSETASDQRQRRRQPS